MKVNAFRHRTARITSSLSIIVFALALSAPLCIAKAFAASGPVSKRSSPPPAPPSPPTPPARSTPPLDAVQMRRALEDSGKAEGRVLADFELTDQNGARFRLRDNFGPSKRPLVVSFIYTSCPEVCPTITSELRKAVLEARKRYGDSFAVLSLSFDPLRDTPPRLRKYALRFPPDPSFTFAAPRPEDTESLMREFGFFFRRKADGSFDHLDMATVVRPDGTIYKQVYSTRTQPGLLVERLGELITGEIAPARPSSLIDRLKYFCYKYDPEKGRYVPDYPVLASMALQLAVFALIIGVVWGGRIRGFFKRLFHRA